MKSLSFLKEKCSGKTPWAYRNCSVGGGLFFLKKRKSQGKDSGGLQSEEATSLLHLETSLSARSWGVLTVDLQLLIGTKIKGRSEMPQDAVFCQIVQ